MESIFKQGCLIRLAVSCWSAQMKLSSQLLNKDADPNYIKAKKCLIDKEYLASVQSVGKEARDYLYTKSLPFDIPGILFVPKDMISEIDAKLSKYKREFEDKVDAFAGNYKSYVDKAEDALGEYYDPQDYPVNIARKFAFAWSFFEIEAPNGKANILSPEIYEREKQKFMEMIAEFEETAITTLRETFAGMVSHIAESLTQNKVFRNSTIDKFKEFLEDFKKLNINNDAELEALVERCRGLVSRDLEAQDLRDNNILRNQIGTQMEQVKNSMDMILTNKPIRRLQI